MKRPSKQAILWVLVVANAMLLTVLVTRHTAENQAVAQPAGRPGDYIMLPATISGAPNGLIFVLDQSNRVLGGVAYDATNNSLQNIPRIDLGDVFDKANAIVPGGGGVVPKRGVR